MLGNLHLSNASMLDGDESCLLMLEPPFDCCIPFLTNFKASLRFLNDLNRDSLLALTILSASSFDSNTYDSGSGGKIKLRRFFYHFVVFQFNFIKFIEFERDFMQFQ